MEKCSCGYPVTSNPEEGDHCPNCGIELLTQNASSCGDAVSIVISCAPDATLEQVLGALWIHGEIVSREWDHDNNELVYRYGHREARFPL